MIYSVINIVNNISTDYELILHIFICTCDYISFHRIKKD